MIKLLLNLAILSFSGFALSKDPLAGHLFGNCDISKDVHVEYFTEFNPKNEEFEVELYKRVSKKGCKGKDIFAVGRIWHYEVNDNELITTLKTINVVLMDASSVDLFNKMKFCYHAEGEIKNFE